MTPVPSLLLKSALCASLLAASGAFAQTAVDVTVTAAPTASTTATTAQDFATRIAKADLSQQGIANPTSAQLGAATNQVQGLRDAGMGWGAIANSLGLRLGDVVSDANQAKQAVLARDAAADKSQKSTKTGVTDKDRSTVASTAVGTGLSLGGQGNAGGSAGGKGGGNGGGNGGGKGGGGGKR